MADKRTVFAIPADTWVRVINGATTGTIYKKNIIPVYVSMIFDDAGDTPVDGVIPATAEVMFRNTGEEFIEPTSDSAAIYVWVACARAGVSGSVTATI